MSLRERKAAMDEIIAQAGEDELGKLKLAAFFALLFFCVFIPLRSVLERALGSYVKIIPDLIILVLFVWYSVAIRLRYQFRVHDWLLIAFVAVGAVNTVFFQHLGVGRVVFQLRSIGIYYIFYFVIRNLKFGKREFNFLLDTLNVMSAVLAFFGLIERAFNKKVLFPPEWLERIELANRPRVYSLFGNPNTYGLFLVLTVFLCLIAYLAYGRKTGCVWYGINVLGLLLSMSRSSFIIFALGIGVFAVYFVVKNRKNFPYRRVLAMLLTVAVISGSGYMITKQVAIWHHRTNELPTWNGAGDPSIGLGNRLDNSFTDREIERSAFNGRIFSIKTGLAIFRDYPVMGAGFGTFGSAAGLNYENPLNEKYKLWSGFYADNEYIKVIAENGALGVLLFGAFLISILVFFRKEPLKIFLCITIGWFGIFFNIFEVQIGAMLFWSVLAFDELKMKKEANE